MRDRFTQAMTAGNRSGERLSLGADKRASVGVRVGLRYLSLPVLDVHEEGLGFDWPDGPPEFVNGSRFPGAVLKISDHEIRGELEIRHVTSSISTGTQCGARFHPASAADRTRLVELVQRLRAETRAVPPQPAFVPSARPEGGARPLQCPYCLAELDPHGSLEESICPYCVRPLV